MAALEVQIKHGESELNAVRSELGAAKTQASSYLDVLRTREWRRGFDQNMFRELDAQVGAAHAGWRGAFEGVAEAHQLMLENKHLGKISILVGADAEGEGKTAEGPGAIRAEVGA